LTAAGQATRAMAGPFARAVAPVLLAALPGLAAWGLLFRAEAAAAVRVWRESTAYSHCWLVAPIALWLAWDRRGAARGLRPQPTPWPALAVPPLALAWFAAERLGLMEGRQLAAIGMAEALAVALLGWRLAWIFSAALAYLIFLVPFGAFLVPWLQQVTASFIEAGLELLAIPHVVDAFTIEIPEGTFYVAAACAGLRFLIAAVAYGALFAWLTYRSPWRRLAFLAASVVVPILANGLRALGIVVAGHLIGSAEAATADHLIYGWGFFSAVILLLTLAGLPFRQDFFPSPPRSAAVAAPAWAGRALLAAGAVLLPAAIAPLAAIALDRTGALNRTGAVPALALPGFVGTAACQPLGQASPGQASPGQASPGQASPGQAMGPVQHFSCDGAVLTATVRVLPPRATPAALRAARAAATGEQDASDSVTGTLLLDGVRPRQWRLVELHDPDVITATAAWIGGAPDPGGLAGRLRMAWDSVAGGAAPPVLLTASLAPRTLAHSDDREAARQSLRGFLQAQGRLLAALPTLAK
jgi:exosortase A